MAVFEFRCPTCEGPDVSVSASVRPELGPACECGRPMARVFCAVGSVRGKGFGERWVREAQYAGKVSSEAQSEKLLNRASVDGC